MDIFDMVYDEDIPIRLLGITLQDVKNIDSLNKQISLFEQNNYLDDINDVIDEINAKLEHGGKIGLAGKMLNK